MRIKDLVKATDVNAADVLAIDTSTGTKGVAFEDLTNAVTKSFDSELNEESENGVYNKTVTIAVKKLDDLSEILAQQLNGTYEGRNLADVFNGEISRYSNAWEWIKDRVDKGFYKGLYIGDNIPIVVGNKNVRPQIAGIDCYTKTTDQGLGHHIDWISKDCYPDTVKWFTSNDNNGIANDPHPYDKSTVKSFLAGLEEIIQADVKALISSKRFLLEGRYSASGNLNDSTSWGWRELGKLWIPTEYEVFGSIIFFIKTMGGRDVDAVSYFCK